MNDPSRSCRLAASPRSSRSRRVRRTAISTRQRWATEWAEIPGATRHRHRSKEAAYRAVNALAGSWQVDDPRSPHLNVYVDERDRRGLRLYEQVDLRSWGT